MELEKVKNVLEEIGLNSTEAIIYLTLIKKGSSTAYKIAKEAHLYKANTYMAVDSLIRKNLITQKQIKNKQIIRAIPPEELLNNLDRQKEKLQEILPFIERNFEEDLEEVNVFSGLKSFFNLLYNLLEQKQDIYVFDIPSYVPEIVKTHINQFHKERIKRKIVMHHIYDYDAKERIDYLNNLKFTFAKQGVKNRLSLVSTFVCGKITLIINWKKEIKIVKIIDKDVADTYRHQFDILWNYKDNKIIATIPKIKPNKFVKVIEELKNK